MTNEPNFREPHQPARQEIAKRAYAIYLAEGKPQGHAVSHWLRAEKELRLVGETMVTAAPKARARTSREVVVATH